ncbi:MAG: hypothetical protein WC966_00235 [Bradymonadales bacterium]|jgi:hypothetical protein
MSPFYAQTQANWQFVQRILYLRVFVLLIAVCALLSPWKLVFAQELTSQYFAKAAPEQELTVAIVPNTVSLYLYPDTTLHFDIDTAELRQAMQNFVVNYPYTKLLTHKELVKKLQVESPARASAYGQSLIDIGYARTHLSNFSIEPAISLLSRIIDNHQVALTYAYAPLALAEAYQYLGYALLDKVANEPELEATLREEIRSSFLEMVRLAPHVVLRSGRQPEERVVVYNEARHLFLQNSAIRKTGEDLAQRIADALKVDVLLFPRVVQNAEGKLFLEIDLFEAKSQSLQSYSIKLDAPANNKDYKQYFIQQLQSLLAEAFLCLEPHQVKVDDGYKSQANRFYLELGYAQQWFFEYPTSSIFTNIGASIKLTYMFNDNVFLLGNFSITHSLQDKSKDLITTFNHLRFIISSGISRQFRYARPFLGFGLELAYTTPFKTSKSEICKAFGINDWECLDSEVRRHDIGAEGGFNILLGTDIGAEHFFLVLEFMLSAYVLPVEGKVLNFAAAYRLALQYRF